MTDLQEKRLFERYSLHRGSVANINGKKAYSTVTNISEMGLAFVCALKVQHGVQIELALEFKEGNATNTFSVIVEVVRCLQEDFEYSIGVIVKTITQEFKTLLEQIKFSREKYVMMI